VKPAAILVVPVVAAAVLALFAWPNARMAPRDLPVGVAGSAAAVAPVEARLAAEGGAFAVHRYADQAAAVEAIEDREVYGAIVVSADGPAVLTASAASPAVAQLMTHAVPAGATVRDVVAAGPRGASLGSCVLPLMLAGLLTGALAATLASSALGRAGLVVAGSVLGGVAATLVVDSWLDVLGGDWFANAGAMSLFILAIASLIAGLKALMGEVGIAVGALTMILVGNPFSAVSSAPELLPRPVGGLGQLLPPGAGGNLLRSTGFFDGAAAGGHVAVLCAWAAAGALALAAAAVRGRRPVSAPAPVPA
jgi:hypothetical protein